MTEHGRKGADQKTATTPPMMEPSLEGDWIEVIPEGGRSMGEQALARTEEILAWINQDRTNIRGLMERIARIERHLGIEAPPNSKARGHADG